MYREEITVHPSDRDVRRSQVRGHDGDVRGAPPRELFREFVGQAERLIKEEVRLAKIEIRDEVKGAARGGAMVGSAAVVGLVALIVLSFFAVYLLATAMPLWAGALIVGVILAIVAGVVGAAGAKRLKKVNAMPEETIQTLREDQRWAKETMHDVRSRTHGTA